MKNGQDATSFSDSPPAAPYGSANVFEGKNQQQKNSFSIEDTQVDTEDLEGSFKMQPMQIENLLKGVKE